MNALTPYMAISILATVSGLAILPAFALEQACPDCGDADSTETAMMNLLQESPITVWTDRSVYDHESTIMVEGTVAHLRIGAEIGLLVSGGPFNNIVTAQQLKVGSDGKFQTTLSTAGELWKYDGTYTIKVTYGTQEVYDTTQVVLTGGIIGMPKVTCDTNEFPASAQCIPFDISGAVVTSAWLNTDEKSLVVNINTNDDGMITINPSRNVISGIFMVLVDGEEWDDVEINGNKVTVMFPYGAEQIEIIGTFVIPEFGTITALIFAVAIISIIAVSAKTRLKVLPKY